MVAQYNMTAEVLKQVGDPSLNVSGRWEYRQNEVSGSIERVWVSDTSPEPGQQISIFPCFAKGISMKTGETFEATYSNKEYVELKYPPGVSLSRRDKITKIGNNDGVIWLEEEIDRVKPTVFNIQSITPITDVLGVHVQNVAVLFRAEVQ